MQKKKTGRKNKSIKKIADGCRDSVAGLLKSLKKAPAALRRERTQGFHWIFKKRPSFSVEKPSPPGFSFVEMMTALGIAGVLGVTGLNSYRKQRHQARAAQAQYLLSNIYTAEKNFKSQWGAYHENLYIIGAIPEGEIYYDAGFSPGASISKTDGKLAYFPWVDRLQARKCTNFHQICNLECADEVNTLAGSGGHGASYYGGFACRVTGGLHVMNYTGGVSYEAGENSFKAIARAVLNSDDEWTIDQEQKVTHILDGTGN